MFIVMLVIMTETTADILAIGQVIDKPADRQTVTNGLRADMLSTAFASVFNGFSVSAFAQNVGLVAITGIGAGSWSRSVAASWSSSDSSRSWGRWSPWCRCPCWAAPGWRCSAPSPRVAFGR